MQNVAQPVVDGFGDEWTRYDQSGLDPAERRQIFDMYFAVFPWERVGEHAVGADVGCGSGRWASLAARRVGVLHCVDASADALAVARRNLAEAPNAVFHHASAGDLPFRDGELDFCYSLGVLHHIPDTAAGIAECARVLKPGAPLLLYLYYAFDNRAPWYRAVWKASEAGRYVISRLPHRMRYVVSQVIATIVYWPLARMARQLERAGAGVESFPLSSYRDKSFYTMRTDALDRFGTRLEQRFTRTEIKAMMERAGLDQIRFSDEAPYWCAVGFKR